MSRYFVVPFTYAQVQENRDVDFNIEIELALVETERALREEPRLKVEALAADLRFYRRSVACPDIAEYDQYSEVIFLNEGAMRICHDRGMAVDVLKIVPEEELPAGLGVQCRKPYLPKVNRRR